MKQRRSNKIGIMSLYYKNLNMGGALQAYALTYVISKLGGNVEQISFDYRRYYNTGLSRKFNRVKMKLASLIKNRRFRARNRNFEKFMDQIPHSKYCSDVGKYNKSYDAIVVGSDQVWGEWLPIEALKQYLLYSDKYIGKKYSYAASIGSDTLSGKNELLYADALSKFATVSVREYGACELLRKIGIPATVNVDPTVLLSAEEWDKVAKKVEKPEKYIFCYFLGAEKAYRASAEELAKTLGLPIITIPYARHHKDEGYEQGFGDYQDYKSGPAEFIDLIKNAELVITDSFHATVFASKYHVNFYALARIINGDASSNGRLVDYLSLVNMKNRYVTPEELSKKSCEIGIDYSDFDAKIQIHIKNGLEYLKSIVEETK